MEISLVGHFTGDLGKKEVLFVQWISENGREPVHLSETLLILLFAMTILFVRDIVNKNQSVFFMPGVVK